MRGCRRQLLACRSRPEGSWDGSSTPAGKCHGTWSLAPALWANNLLRSGVGRGRFVVASPWVPPEGLQMKEEALSPQGSSPCSQALQPACAPRARLCPPWLAEGFASSGWDLPSLCFQQVSFMGSAFCRGVWQSGLGHSGGKLLMK